MKTNIQIQTKNSVDGIHAPIDAARSALVAQPARNEWKLYQKRRLGLVFLSLLAAMMMVIFSSLLLCAWFGFRDMAEHIMIGFGGIARTGTAASVATVATVTTSIFPALNASPSSSPIFSALPRPSESSSLQSSSFSKSSSSQASFSAGQFSSAGQATSVVQAGFFVQNASTAPSYFQSDFQSALASITPGFGGGAPPAKVPPASALAQGSASQAGDIVDDIAADTTFTVLSPDPPLADCSDGDVDASDAGVSTSTDTGDTGAQ